MIHESLAGRDWQDIVRRLGGADALEASARASKAFRRSRVVGNAVDMLRLILAYCLGEKGLRLTSAWAASTGFLDISNVGLLYRLRQSGDWLGMLVGEALTSAAPRASRGRLIRIVDATCVPKAGQRAKQYSEVWRIHSAFDLPHERFGYFELTDEREGETIDRIPVVPGEIRLGDRAYLQAGRIGTVLEQGADVLVRAGWRSAAWLDENGDPLDLIAVLRDTRGGIVEQPVSLARKKAAPLSLRLVAVRKPPQACTEARRLARRNAQREGYQISEQTLIAADWVILVTSLDPNEFSTDDVLALYRLRWRIELAFKRLKSLIGLKGPPGTDERSARTYILAHLLMILLLEPLVDELEDSPHWATAA